MAKTGSNLTVAAIAAEVRVSRKNHVRILTYSEEREYYIGLEDRAIPDFQSALDDIYGFNNWGWEDVEGTVELYIPQADRKIWIDQVSFMRRHVFGGRRVFVRNITS